MNYYNDNDPKTCAWLRELIAQGHLPQGTVDERSILEIRPDDLAGFDQCHFFAGIGGWPLALRWAGLEGVAGIWSGSCPCQPLSCAGKRQGHADERHLWPAFHALISQRRPATVFGEQVASKDGREWFAGVRLDLEGLGYACGGADLCAAGVGAPHRRQRLFWVADTQVKSKQHVCGGRGDVCCEGQAQQAWVGGHAGEGRATGGVADAGHEHMRRGAGCGETEGWGAHAEASGCGPAGRVADAQHDGRRADEPGREAQGRAADGRACGMGYATGGGCGVCGDAAQPGRGGHADRAGWARAGGMADTDGERRQAAEGHGEASQDGQADPRPELLGQLQNGLVGSGRSDWSRFDILPCRDGKARRVEAGTFPLADGIPGRMGLLRGYGNAIVPEVAEVFVRAWIDCGANAGGDR